MPTATQTLCQLLNIQSPIVQAPMAGFMTPPLIAAVCEAGGLGSIGGAYFTPERLQEEIQAVRALTDKPFNVNLFAGGWNSNTQADPAPMLSLLQPYYQQFNLEFPRLLSEPSERRLHEQIDVLLAEKISIFSFTFGIPSAKIMTRLKQAGITIIGTATNVSEAKALEQAGVDIISGQGSEAGAHRGTFLGSFEASMIGTMALVPQIVDAVSIPVLAAGGVMDGRGIAAALALGASGAQLGTAFMTCTDSVVPTVHKHAIRHAMAENTKTTKAFTGRPARGITNQLMQEIEQHSEIILPFPIQGEVTSPIRKAAATIQNPELLSLWAGQGAPLSRELSAKELMQVLVQETNQTLKHLQPI